MEDPKDKPPQDLKPGLERETPIPLDHPSLAISIRNPMTGEIDGAVWITSYRPDPPEAPEEIEVRGFPVTPPMARQIALDLIRGAGAVEDELRARMN